MKATPEEIDYLCASASEYFSKPVARDDIVRVYSGVRPLYDKGGSAAQAATRDYVLELDAPPDAAPLLSVFGGKLTTYRRLAEAALGRLTPFFPRLPAAWTTHSSLPGGDFPVGGADALRRELATRYPFLPAPTINRLARSYGTQTQAVLGNARSTDDLGRHFGAGLYEREVLFLIATEWARTAEDVLWRRSKLGLRLTGTQVLALQDCMSAHACGPADFTPSRLDPALR